MEIVLYQPEIAGNVGAIIRLAANSGISLNLIKPFGFDLQENKIRRAGLDYHDLSNTKTYNSWEEFREKNTKKSICCLSSKGTDSYWDTNLNKYDFLLFGPESIGLPNEIISRTEKNSWHNYKGDGKNNRVVLVYNLMTTKTKEVCELEGINYNLIKFREFINPYIYRFFKKVF